MLLITKALCWLKLPLRTPLGLGGKGGRTGSQKSGLRQIDNRVAGKWLCNYLPVRNVTELRMAFDAEMQRTERVRLDLSQDFFVLLATRHLEHGAA